jgi:RNA polymerase sigma-70 factor (sigma-E family)
MTVVPVALGVRADPRPGRAYRARPADRRVAPGDSGVVERAAGISGVRVTEAPDGFRDFVAARWTPLLRVAWSLTGDWALAEDLLQTALAKVWPRWSAIRRTDDPDVYVRRVLVTTYATWWRRKWRGEVPTDELPEHAGAAFAVARPDPADSVVLQETLRRALATLPRRQRAVVVLRYVEDLPEAEVALVLGCSVGTVKSQASKALSKLRGSPALAGISTGTGEATGGSGAQS